MANGRLGSNFPFFLAGDFREKMDARGTEELGWLVEELLVGIRMRNERRRKLGCRGKTSPLCGKMIMFLSAWAWSGIPDWFSCTSKLSRGKKRGISRGRAEMCDVRRMRNDLSGGPIHGTEYSSQYCYHGASRGKADWPSGITMVLSCGYVILTSPI